MQQTLWTRCQSSLKRFHQKFARAAQTRGARPKPFSAYAVAVENDRMKSFPILTVSGFSSLYLIVMEQDFAGSKFNRSFCLTFLLGHGVYPGQEKEPQQVIKKDAPQDGTQDRVLGISHCDSFPHNF
ncbi:hypothetical protein EVAR_62436_1 [Eumeta japonica]|uniref:Uncharacterized protein n=1 Tax=Eumeta variegata TaxID=151549 RepID=A0A4C1Z7X6_EUMVA|nr:hypothetical protein EVAR_62436_1 [Eumeta japonica]